MPSDDSTLRDDEDPLEPGDLDLGLAPAPEASSEPESPVGEPSDGEGEK
jgi:segregation and condensation protein B